MQITIKNKGPGLKTFKNLRGQDVTIQPGDSRTFAIHPHHLKLLKRESAKEGSKIELVADATDLAVVEQPGGNMTDEEKRLQEEHRLQEAARLRTLRVASGQSGQVHEVEHRTFTDPKTVDEKVVDPDKQKNLPEDELGKGAAETEKLARDQAARETREATAKEKKGKGEERVKLKE